MIRLTSQSSSLAASTTKALLSLVALAAVFGAVEGKVGRNGGPLIIAHRGGASESTENTIAAFRRAIKIGAEGIETDIRLTKDDVVVVYHDDYFGRVEGLVPAQRTRLVSEMTYAELTKQTLIPVGEDTGGRKVPTLFDLLTEVKSGLLNIELKKCARFDHLVRQTAAILKGFSDLDRVVLEVPDLETAKTFRKSFGLRLKLHINPDADSTVAFGESLKRVLKFKPHSISISYRKVSREIVDQAHKAGVEVWVWTVNSEDTGVAMAGMGVDAIKTDKPSLLIGVIRNGASKSK